MWCTRNLVWLLVQHTPAGVVVMFGGERVISGWRHRNLFADSVRSHRKLPIPILIFILSQGYLSFTSYFLKQSFALTLASYYKLSWSISSGYFSPWKNKPFLHISNLLASTLVATRLLISYHIIKGMSWVSGITTSWRKWFIPAKNWSLLLIFHLSKNYRITTSVKNCKWILQQFSWFIIWPASIIIILCFKWKFLGSPIWARIDYNLNNVSA